jgi:phosphatidylglycerol---prolipoprotein diacylglyceryl transferase
MILNYIHWDINPEIFRIGSFAVRWYGLLFAMAFYAGYLVFTRIFKQEGIALEVLDKLTLYVFIGTVLGARLGHCLFYQPEYYLSHPIEIIKIWEGGLASHGAGIGILIALWFFARNIKKPYFWIIDRVAMTVALAGFFIRLGNLMNSEIIGKQFDASWAFVLHRIDEIPRHPAQLYESFSYLTIFLVLWYLFNKTNMKEKQGLLFSIFLTAMFIVRFLVEYVKEVQVDFEESMFINMGQVLSIPFILIGIILMIYILLKKDEKRADA